MLRWGSYPEVGSPVRCWKLSESPLPLEWHDLEQAWVTAELGYAVVEEARPFVADWSSLPWDVIVEVDAGVDDGLVLGGSEEASSKVEW